ncbi:phosphoglucosamine mutase [Candidatus Bathyarchaeota archaeon]|nr:MAG: phosphoglucosamine mutase [Candidatus Bathyarchaeota archaeon]
MDAEAPQPSFGTFGLRGVANVDLTPQLALKIGLCMANYLGPGKTVVVGRDPRTSSAMLSMAVSSGLLSGGCNVKDVGLVTTPALSFAVKTLKADGGVMITASHNPPEWNGIKLWNGDGSGFSRTQDRVIEDMLRRGEFRHVDWSHIGRLERVEGIPDMYVEGILSRVDVDTIRRRGYRVVLDCGGGSACYSSPKLLRKLGCDLKVINCRPDGFFKQRLPEPRPENLSRLMETVRSIGADLGVAHDGDADRAAFIDEKGRYVQGDRILALICLNYLRNRPKGLIVTTVITSSVIYDVAEMVGARVILTPVGEPYVVEKMKETGAEIGGEENVGLIVRDWVWSREGAYAVALVLELMAKEGRSLSELSESLPRYEQAKLNVRCDREVFPLIKHRVIELVKEMLPKDYDRLVTIDGVKAYYGRNWVLVRPSGTEPLFRVFAEAEDKTTLEELKRLGVKATEDAVKELTDKIKGGSNV